jgi:hypothetical protein
MSASSSSCTIRSSRPRCPRSSVDSVEVGHATTRGLDDRPDRGEVPGVEPAPRRPRRCCRRREAVRPEVAVAALPGRRRASRASRPGMRSSMSLNAPTDTSASASRRHLADAHRSSVLPSALPDDPVPARPERRGGHDADEVLVPDRAGDERREDGLPLTKFVVPSIGSIVQTGARRRIGGPLRPTLLADDRWSGNAPRMRSRSASSTATSVSVTSVPSAFRCTSGAAGTRRA